MFRAFGGENINIDFERLEKKTNMKLPKDYKEFLAKTNGGVFVDDLHGFYKKKIDEDAIIIDVLFSAEDNDKDLCIDLWYDEYDYELPKKSVIIGNTMGSGLLVLFNQFARKGVYLWDSCLELEKSTEKRCLYKLANSFESFYNSIKLLEDPDDE